ncbi:integrase catalytic domain-containing protein [Trichonephila clavipes]|uniref:Integrase catalytic domain-containing protein n=1 Tax=Trichonephila clavipes TaxID=2585209 RepID=A0A8X6RWF6_TRICX|nr:integrase catalytic domain-containing protein [Trichonephila clavipes]
MPFGLSTCPSTFMRYINAIFHLISKSIVLPYMDDVVIPAANESQALEYLKNVLESAAPRASPREIVESFPATAANYKKAIEYLKERYGNSSVWIQVYIRDLLQQVMAKIKSDLSSLYDKLQTRIRALDSLGLTKDKYTDILFPLVESALPVDIVKLWERQRHLSTDKSGRGSRVV